MLEENKPVKVKIEEIGSDGEIKDKTIRSTWDKAYSDLI